MMKISIICSAIIVSICATSCGTDTNLLPNQRESMESYLNGKGASYTKIDGSYRYIVNTDRNDYNTQTVIARGDSASYYFEAYIFSSGPGTLYFTNKAHIIKSAQITSPYWTTDPMKIKLGSTPLMSALNSSLEGCRTGDSVVVLIPFDKGYSDKQVGVIEANTPLMYILNIENVKKQ